MSDLLALCRDAWAASEPGPQNAKPAECPATAAAIRDLTGEPGRPMPAGLRESGPPHG